jgi:copper transport protein
VSGRGRLTLLVLLAALAAALMLPGSAFAHAVLTAASPEATGVVTTAPAQVALTYSEPVEPRFAIISVTDAGGHQEVAGSPRRSPANANQIAVPLQRIPQGWYLVYWRVISADGHPVRGAFTFAVGPSPGPPPQFAIPSLSETAATPSLVTARWVAFLAIMAALGLFVFRTIIARPLVRLVPGVSLRGVSIALIVALGVALLAIPVYLALSTAQFALRPVTDLGALIPVMRASAFGRALIDLEIVVALFALAALICLAVDRPARAVRSSAELMALVGALLAGAGLMLVPGLSGHPSQTSPRGLYLALDWLHLTAGSIWIGGLVGLLLLWWRVGAERRVAALGRVVPRFSRVAFGSVMLLLASGTVVSILRLPTLGSLWQTTYGIAILVKVGLLLGAMALAAVNLARTRPRLVAAAARKDAALGTGAATLLRRLVTGEVAIVVGIIFAASILSSVPPPAKALADVGTVSARVGPGAVNQVVTHGPYRIAVGIAPNRVALSNDFRISITKDGRPVTGAGVLAGFAMLDMEMGQQAYTLPEREPGVYRRASPALVMVGHWGVTFEITPPGEQPFRVTFIDKAEG